MSGAEEISQAAAEGFRFVAPICHTCGEHHQLVRKFNGGSPIIFFQAICDCAEVEAELVKLAPTAPVPASDDDIREWVASELDQTPPENPTIRRNAARCDECGEVIESRYRHNYVRCSCGALAVDGGLDYPRRVFQPDKRWTDLTEYVDG